MKKIIKKEMDVEVISCNICGEVMHGDPFNMERVKIVRHLFKTNNFDAHESCVNRVVKQSFSRYINPIETGEASENPHKLIHEPK